MGFALPISVSGALLWIGPVMAQERTIASYVLAPARVYDGSSGFEPDDPRSFSIAVPEGNWRVSLTIGNAAHAATTTVKAEARRLMIDRLKTRKGEFVERNFVVNVRMRSLTAPPANAPGGAKVALKSSEEGSRTWDDRLTLDFSDPADVRRITLEQADVPTIYLVGDSTVTDQRYEPAASWGQMLPAFAGSGVAVANHAESGETLKSFLAELRLAKVLSTVREGDYLFIQFGHNDQKSQWPQTYVDPRYAYPAYLRTYIAEARARKAIPVLVTPPERRNFEADGSVRETLTEYADAMRSVAERDNVPLIDLNAFSRTLYSELGEEQAALLFNDGGKDRTHHDNAGAWLLARFVAAEARTGVPGLRSAIEPVAAGSPEENYRRALGIVASSASSTVRPEGN
ncbi:rhamnogalacturonan acetylesterase [Qipengyuania sp.]|uniref:rhamnogalacturonan acetylesterase n=1 Tax=Qipengyuania sp. TaxID=2004515 RepID=UPI0035C8150C